MDICLVMIVKNEARVIERCLASAKPFITHWCIVDTGSTDDTQDKIRELLKDIPGELHQRPWQNFGANRTEAFRLAKSFIGIEGYALLLDADHELKGTLGADSLRADCYRVEQRDSTLSYANIRLVRTSLPWRAVGVTHEYWAADGAGPSKTLASLTIVDHADGGMRGDKLLRDRDLLLVGIADEPTNERYKFYLAQTYDEIGDHEAALHWYAQRAALGGFEEERWMARLRRAKVLDRTGRHLEAQTEYLRAWDERPTRAEPLYHLARMWRIAGKNHAAYMFASMARSIKRPNDILFVEHNVYTHLCDEEISISAWYIDKHEEGFAATERLLATPGANHATALANQTFYVKPIRAVDAGEYAVPEHLRTFEGVLYHCSNPTILDDFVHVRLVNYEQTHGRHYVGRPEPGVIRTKNAVLHRGEAWILDDSILETWNQDVRIFGLEDIRAVDHSGPWFTATCCQVPGAGGSPRVVIGRMSSDRTRVEHLRPLTFDGAQRVEKNWLPWAYAGQLHLIYSFEPFTLLSVNLATGECEVERRDPVKSFAGRFRGSAAPIQWRGRTLALVHDVARLPNRNVYTHRFALFGTAGDVTYSEPFYLEHAGIEYATGMQAVGDGVRITYGCEDKFAKWIDVDGDTIVS